MTGRFSICRSGFILCLIWEFASIMALSVGTTGDFFRGAAVFKQYGVSFLGAGFMLIETKAITEMGLQFGNTWHVIGIVIAGILVMVSISGQPDSSVVENQAAGHSFICLGQPYHGLCHCPFRRLRCLCHRKSPDTAGVDMPGIFLLNLCSPPFWPGEVPSPVSWRVNLLGAILGGLAIVQCHVFRVQFLYLLAAGLYLLAGDHLLPAPGSNRITSQAAMIGALLISV